MQEPDEERDYEQEFLHYATPYKRKGERSSEIKAIEAISVSNSVIYSLRLLIQYASEIKDTQKQAEFMRISVSVSLQLAEDSNRLAELMHQNNELKEEANKLMEELALLQKRSDNTESTP
jgi:hypothetical protein